MQEVTSYLEGLIVAVFWSLDGYMIYIVAYSHVLYLSVKP